MSEPAAEPLEVPEHPRLALVPAGPRPGEVEVVTPDEPPHVSTAAARTLLTILRTARERSARPPEPTTTT